MRKKRYKCAICCDGEDVVEGLACGECHQPGKDPLPPIPEKPQTGSLHPDCWETVEATFKSEIREARRARRIAMRGGTSYLETLEYWERYMAALMRFRTILKEKMKPSSNTELSDLSERKQNQ